MVDYETWMSIGLDRCTEPSMSQARRQTVFRDLANGWSRQKETIKDMTEREVRQNIECP